MTLIRVCQAVFGLYLAWFFVTQVLLPLATGRRLFPAFYWRRRRAVSDLVLGREANDLKNLQARAKEIE